MEICLIGPTYPFRGGISHHTTLLYRHLRSRHEVTFISFIRQYPRILFPGNTDIDPSKKHFRQEGVLPILDSMNPLTWLKSAWKIVNKRPDLVILPWWVSFWAPQFWTISLLVKIFSKSKILFLCHNVVEHESKWIGRILTRFVLKKGEFFIVHSTEDQQNLLSMFPEAKVRKSFHPTYDVFNSGDFDPDMIKRKYGTEDNIILFFGFIREYKGLKCLIKSVPEVLSNIRVTLLVVGEFWKDKHEYLHISKDSHPLNYSKGGNRVKTVLVTGGAGFIGSHLVDELVELGHRVRVLDNLSPQVHGKGQEVPPYLNENAEFMMGDVRDRDALKRAIKGVEVIFHQAAAVGVGQSMYDIAHYIEVNVLGTANLLDVLVNEKNGVEKIIVASSMSNYGEGKYHCEDCGTVYPRLRSIKQFEKKEWEMKCPHCQRHVMPIPTDEEKPLHPTSVYATSKRDQEEMFINVGRAYDIPAVALRYFNTYGPRQALSNPYTGVAAIFSSRIINGHNPVIFEDGLQGRDFVHVSDVVQANILAMEKEDANYEIFNVGTGKMTNLLEMVEILIQKLGYNPNIEPEITNKFREGDIRYCYADISKIEKKLGFKPEVEFEEGFSGLINWVMTQTSVDTFEDAKTELESRGLISK